MLSSSRRGAIQTGVRKSQDKTVPEAEQQLTEVSEKHMRRNTLLRIEMGGGVPNLGRIPINRPANSCQK
jgi:hypothetical protein